MTLQQLPRKTYWLAPGWRLLFVAAGLSLLLMSSLPLLPGVNVTGTIADLICLLLLLDGLAALSFWYAFGTRLVTSPAGLEAYALFSPLSVAWNDLERIDVNSFGIVNLVFAQPYARSWLWRWLMRSFSSDRTLQISPFVGHWQNSELLQDLRRYAPHVIIPKDLADRPNVSFQYRASTLIIYYLGILILGAFIPRLASAINPQIARSLSDSLLWSLAVTGLLGGLVGGGAGLASYDAWLRTGAKGVAKYALAQYLLPLSGFGIGLFIGAAAQLGYAILGLGPLTRAQAGLLGLLVLMLGMLQSYPLQRRR